MSERRQLALLLVGAVALVAIGIVGATVFPEGCSDLEQVGELDLELHDAADALPLSADDGAAVEAIADELGIGTWRGAVALPAGASVYPSEFGFFVVTEDAFTVLRPSFGLASAARGRAGLDVVPAGTSLALRAADGEVGVFNGEYELDRCGSLPADREVLALDRGIAVLRDGSEVAAVTLSGNELFRAPAVAAAHVSGDTIVLGEGRLLELRDVRGGEVLDEVTDVPVTTPEPWIDAVDDRLLLRTEGGVVPVVIGAAALDRRDPVDLPLDVGPALDAVTTPSGIVAHGLADDRGGRPTAALATDRAAQAAPFPAGVGVQALLASRDGHVGVVVEVDGSRALLVYGRDADE